jgi:hypothetical protein
VLRRAVGVVAALLPVRARASVRRHRRAAGREPGRAHALLPDAAQIAYLDVDDTVRATYGHAKQGAGYGYTGVTGLNTLLATLSTPASAPVIVESALTDGLVAYNGAQVDPDRPEPLGVFLRSRSDDQFDGCPKREQATG